MPSVKDETWTSVWVVRRSAKLAAIYGPIAGLYLNADAAQAHAASGGDEYKVVEWAASNRFHCS